MIERRMQCNTCSKYQFIETDVVNSVKYKLYSGINCTCINEYLTSERKHLKVMEVVRAKFEYILCLSFIEKHINALVNCHRFWKANMLNLSRNI